MANWKKVIISGSQAELAGISASALTTLPAVSGEFQVLVTGSNGAFFVTGSNALGGSSGTTTEALTDGNGIANFSFNGSAAASVAVEADGTTLSVGSSGVKVANSGIGTTQLADNAVTTAKLPDSTLTSNGVTFAKMQHVAGNTVVVNNSATTGDLSTLAMANAQILINNGTGFTAAVLSGDVTMDNTGNVTIASTFTPTLADLTQGEGITSFTYNGSAKGAVSLKNAGNLTANRLVQWDDSNGQLVNSLISGTATTLQIGQANTNVTTFKGDVIMEDDLTVRGTASFEETTNLKVADRFISLASGSGQAGDGGIVIEQSSVGGGNGQVFGFDEANGGRWGLLAGFNPTASSFTPTDLMVTTVTAASNPTVGTSPTYGGANGQGNMHVNTSTGDIFIYA